jgi:hypothetical protein
LTRIPAGRRSRTKIGRLTRTYATIVFASFFKKKFFFEKRTKKLLPVSSLAIDVIVFRGARRL